MTEVERSLADTLARTVAGDCWSLLATRADDEASRDLMVSRALGLYGTLVPVMEAWIDDLGEIVEAAFTSLRMIADGYAMLSNKSLSATEREQLPIPTRGSVEWLIRSCEVDRWAESLGHPLELRGDSAAFEAPPDDPTFGPYKPGEAEEMLASGFLQAVRGFKVIRDIWTYAYDVQLPSLGTTGREYLRSDKLQDIASRDIRRARGGVVWTRKYVGLDAEAVAFAQLFTAQGVFVATHETAHDMPLFPDGDFMTKLLNRSGAYGWLIEHGVELPDWLIKDT